jgi:CHAD domain-containing protein
VKRSVEREVKLETPEGFVLPELGGRPLPARTFVSTYHDTPDLVLARHGVTFRHRVEDGSGLWQLKLPQGAARIELELAGPPARPPAEMLALLVALLRRRDVVPVARLRTRREGVRAHGAEITQDSVAVLEGQRVTRRFHELEVELLEGDERTLRRLELQLREAGAELVDPLQLPKLYRALDLAAPPEPMVIPDGTPPVVAIGMALAEQRRRLLLHDPGTRLGDDIEDLHQLRVATRRLRAFLRAGRPLLDHAWVESLREEIGWLGRELGPARDLDVLVERFSGDVATLGQDADAGASLLAGLEAERTAARAVAVEALSSDRYLALLDRLDAVGTPPLSGVETPLREIWRQEWKRTRKSVAALPDEPADDELHAIRIRVKRARYAAELAAHELGKRGAAFVSAAKDVQDVLGEHQDATVAEERIRAWAAASPGVEEAAERLVELERGRRREMRAAWPAAWKALEKAASRLL